MPLPRPTLVLTAALLFCAGLAQAQPARTAAPTMRVRLLANRAPERITVQARGGAVNVFPGDASGRLTRLRDGETATLSRRGNELHLSRKSTDLYALALRFAPDGEAMFSLNGDALAGERTSYPGALLVTPDDADRDAIRLVNRVDLETYVASVLGSEYGLKDREGTKAMAVAARTYALHASGKPQDGEYDLGDQVWSQRYEGARGLSEATLRASRATSGEVITYDGALIKAFYFSSSGGHTANNEDVWEGAAVPYLRGKPDPYDEAASPHIPWTERLSRRKLLRALSRTFDGRITGFVIRSRSADGRVATLELLRRGEDRLRVSGSRFRRVVNQHFGYKTLLSTFFDARRDGSRYVFRGKGFGHGVGLSQWGAHEMARRGRSYKEILRFYYTGVTVESIKEVNAATLARAEPETTPVEEEPPPVTEEAPPPERETPSEPIPNEETSSGDAPREDDPLVEDVPDRSAPDDTLSAAPSDSSSSARAAAPADTLATPPARPKKKAEKKTTGRIGW